MHWFELVPQLSDVAHGPLVTKFSLNWLSGSGKGRFFFLNHQSIVPNLLSSPLLKGCDPSFERSFINPLPNDACAKFGYNFLWSVALETKLFKFRQYSFAFSLLSPLLKGGDTSFRWSGNLLSDVPSFVIEDEYYQFFSIYLCTLVIISCLKSAWLFF